MVWSLVRGTRTPSSGPRPQHHAAYYARKSCTSTDNGGLLARKEPSSTRPAPHALSLDASRMGTHAPRAPKHARLTMRAHDAAMNTGSPRVEQHGGLVWRVQRRPRGVAARRRAERHARRPHRRSRHRRDRLVQRVVPAQRVACSWHAAPSGWGAVGRGGAHHGFASLAITSAASPARRAPREGARACRSVSRCSAAARQRRRGACPA